MDIILMLFPLALIITIYAVIVKKYKLDKITLVINLIISGVFLVFNLLKVQYPGQIIDTIITTIPTFLLFYIVIFGIKSLIITLKDLIKEDKSIDYSEQKKSDTID